ncbi:glycosyltransferase [Desulfuromonas sp. KJ2020]|uniref:glycosyltransferase family 2 protein n=1 Tax=Desulfuromonas sp. KJ2020 TaxID=2919173 RepID=UPI0020A73C28|nr:glycosyltransferase family 2 protein [Desulfuromonas sp. KJ2020]MCP3178140.1 glycosyltransferase [Desulfuromonas sp. KJ2020]
MKPKISVIIPTYNREKLITETIESVFNQTYKDIEIIVIDDGSTDNTVNIVKKLQEQSKLPFRVELLLENLGVSAARNLGVFLAKGDYVSFLDSDDYWFSDKLKKQIEFLDSNQEFIGVGSGVAYTNYNNREIVNFRKQTKLNKENEKYELLYQCYIVTSCFLIRKEALILAGLFDVRLSKTEDRDLWWRLPRFGRLGYIDEPLVRYLVHNESISKIQSKNTAKTYIPALDRTLWYYRDSLSKKQIDNIWANAYMMIAYDSANAGDNISTIKNIIKSFRYGNVNIPSLRFMIASIYKSIF